MYRHIFRNTHRASSKALTGRLGAFPPRATLTFVRGLSLDAKYTEKLQQRAKDAGLSVEELKEKAKREAEERRAKERQVLEATLPPKREQQPSVSSTNSSMNPKTRKIVNERKDSSPVKPLSSIFNLERLFSTPHTTAQISALWTAYHVASSGGTGRGVVCANVPLDLHKQMEGVAQKYPTFVVPLARPRPADAGPLQPGESENAYEFYFMQWNFHERPPVPSADADPFVVPSPESSPNPPVATVLFTPLQEYKLRQAFSTPYLIATFYTDLASTHDTVLMRGEITPSAASPNGGPDRYLLSQEDAQVLIVMLQKFFLWSQKDAAASKVLQTFHEKPGEFNWEELIQASNLTV